MCVCVSDGERMRERESFRWVYLVLVRHACGEFEGEREREEPRDGGVVRERVTDNELGNLCAYHYTTTLM